MNRLPDPEILATHGPCWFLNKPGGLLTQAPPGIDSLESRVKQYVARQDERAGKVYLGVPHRLDRPASGILVVARHVRAARKLADQFQQRKVLKQYWAVVEGNVEPESGTWTDYLRKVPGEARSEMVERNAEGAQYAELAYRVLGRQSGQTWLEIELMTGRTHQIRLQTSHRGFPILGDALYSSRHSFGPQETDLRKRWIALHARRLALDHPMTGERVDVTAPVAKPWRELSGFSF